MRNPKTGAERVAANAARKKKQGLVKMSVSAWVPAAIKAECQGAAKLAIAEQVKKHSKAST